MTSPVALRRGGFSLIELLIVVFIIAILIQLTLPAIQSSREAARRSSCQNNLRQLGIAIHSYEGAKRGLPIGSNSCCMGTWMPALFPYMEEEAAYEAYHFEPADAVADTPRYDSDVNLEVTGRFYAAFTCPSDKPRTLDGASEVSKHSYVVNYGNTACTGSGKGEREGLARQGRTAWMNYESVEFQGAPFFVNRNHRIPAVPIRIAEITDGLSQTLFVSEAVQASGNDLRGTIWHSHGSGFMSYLGPNSSDPDVMESRHHCNQLEGNPPCRNSKGDAPVTYAARSRHPGGVNALRGDGSVQFDVDDVDLNTWRALSTTQGGETAY